MRLINYYVVTFLIIFSAICYSAPSITGVNGVVSDQQSITVTGESFGSGPSVILFDDFEGVNGQDISLAARSGSWSSYGTYKPKYATGYKHSGNSSALMCDNDTMRQVIVTFDNTTEAYVSYWVYLPSDKYFPETTELLTTAGNSAWKTSWLLQDNSTGKNDIVAVTWLGTWTSVTGNDLSLGDIGRVARTPASDPYEEWFVFGEWVRVSVWLKADETNPDTSNGTIKAEFLSNTRGYYSHTITTPIFASGTIASPTNAYGWNQWNLPGWVGDPNAYDTTFYHDDVYIASGSNSAARVEIGNSSIYSNCTNTTILTPTAWSITSVTATVNQGSFSTGGAYLFVIDSDGSVSTGYPITISESSVTATAPGTASMF